MANLTGAKTINFDLPPIQPWYKFKITKAESKLSAEKYDEKSGEMKGGNPMISISAELIDAGEFTGKPFFDNFLTEKVNPNTGKEVGGAGISAEKLKGLGYDTDAEPGSTDKALPVDDEVLVNQLLGMEGYVKLKYGTVGDPDFGYKKPKMVFNPNTNKDEPQRRIEPHQYALTPPTAKGGKPSGGATRSPSAPAPKPTAAPKAPSMPTNTAPQQTATPPADGETPAWAVESGTVVEEKPGDAVAFQPTAPQSGKAGKMKPAGANAKA